MNTSDLPELDWSVAANIIPGKSFEKLVPTSNSDVLLTSPIYAKHGYLGALKDVWVRENVLSRLEQAATSLPEGLRLTVLDGWRPLAIQQILYTEFHQRIRRSNPKASDAEIDKMTLQFAAKPSCDPKAPSPHITGGAVDVCLADQQGVPLPMGSEFDEPSPVSWTNATVDEVYAERRHTLYQAMTDAGFTNIPSEWWHYDFGNWVWAWYKGKDSAIYGPLEKAPSNQ